MRPFRTITTFRAAAAAAALGLLATAASSTVACGGSSTCTDKPPVNATTKALHVLFEREWDHDLAESPVWASSIGEHRYDDRWDDVSLAAVTRRQVHERDLLEELRRLDRTQLSKEDALSYDLFEYRTKIAIEAQPFKLHLFPINQRGGLQTADEIADELPFTTAKHFADWNARLASFPRYVDQTIEVLTEAIRLGMVHPKLPMARVTAQLDAQIVTDATKSPFFAPYTKNAASLGSLPEAERTRLSNEAKERIGAAVVPAFQKLRAFWVEKYLPACRDSFSASDLPNGAALYAHTVHAYTTTRLTPEQVHGIGLREVARIRAEMEAVKAKAGFTGPLKEFFTFLRTDPKFFFKDGQELLASYRVLSKRVDPELTKVFGRLPRTPYGVLPIPDAVAPDTTTAYYREPAADGSRAGSYFVNLYKPEARPRWEMVALTLHESVPGHHLQIALAMENDGIPKFRRHGDYTAYIEGWGLYAESLGDEMGLYEDPYSKFGQLVYEMWRAVRLVVDTGIHHLKWDRQRGIDFFMENAAKAELDVVNEVDRYIVWPGQALAYKIGELKIKELRKKRTTALGAKFDLKKFHETVLRSGPLPLDVLEREVMSAQN